MVDDLSHSQTHLADLTVGKCHFDVTILCSSLLHDPWESSKSVEIWLRHVYDLLESCSWTSEIVKLINFVRTMYPQATCGVIRLCHVFVQQPERTWFRTRKIGENLAWGSRWSPRIRLNIRWNSVEVPILSGQCSQIPAGIQSVTLSERKSLILRLEGFGHPDTACTWCRAFLGSSRPEEMCPKSYRIGTRPSWGSTNHFRLISYQSCNTLL